MRLTKHWPDATHLPHQPFDNGLAHRAACRQQLARFFGKIHQDGTRFEHACRLSVKTVTVDDRRNPVIRAERQEFGLELIAFTNIDPVQLIGQAKLLQRDGNLVAIGRCGEIDFDHEISGVASMGMRRMCTLRAITCLIRQVTPSSNRIDQGAWRSSLPPWSRIGGKNRRFSVLFTGESVNDFQTHAAQGRRPSP